MKPRSCAADLPKLRILAAELVAEIPRDANLFWTEIVTPDVQSKKKLNDWDIVLTNDAILEVKALKDS